MVFSKEGNKPNRSKLEQTETNIYKNTKCKMQKNRKFFLVFQTFLNDIHQITVHLDIFTHPLSELLQMEVDFY